MGYNKFCSGKLNKRTRFLNVGTVYLTVLIYFIIFPTLVHVKEIDTFTGLTGAQFLNLNFGPRPTAMGEAFTAISDDAYATLWNPAGLGYIYQPEVQVAHQEWFAQTRYELGCFVYPYKWGTLGLSSVYFYSLDMPRIEEGILRDNFNISESVTGISYGKNILNFLSFGFTVKSIQSKLDLISAGSIATDLGLIFRTLSEEISVGLLVQNFGANLKYIDESFSLPQTVRLGLAFKLDLPRHYTSFRFTSELVKPINGNYTVSVGIENWGANVFAIRAGYVYPLAENKLGHLSSYRVGIGLSLKGFLIDYTYVPYGSLEATHRVSVGARFIGPWGGKRPTVSKNSTGLILEPESISPDANGFKDQSSIFPLVTGFKEIESWTIEIKDTKNKQCKLFSGSGSLPLNLIWDGRDVQGQILPDGKYKIILTIKSKKQVTSSPETYITIDTSKPKVRLDIPLATFSPDGDGENDTLPIYPAGDDNDAIAAWELDFINPAEQIVRIYKSTAAIPGCIIWDGKDENKQPLPIGQYTTRFLAEDKAANRTETSKPVEIKVATLNLWIDLSTPTFSPDGDGIADTVTFTLTAQQTQKIKSWMVNILTNQRKNVRVYQSSSTLPTNVVWDGIDEYYRRVVPNGTYIIRFIAYDRAGNETVFEREIMVNIPPKVLIKYIKDANIREDPRGLIVDISSELLFDPGKTNLRPAATTVLQRVVDALKKYANNTVLIEGHTDSSGPDEENMRISSQRAWSVYSFLVKNGIPAKRLQVKGWGETKPIDANDTATGQARNRRVEIIILKTE